VGKKEGCQVGRTVNNLPLAQACETGDEDRETRPQNKGTGTGLDSVITRGGGGNSEKVTTHLLGSGGPSRRKSSLKSGAFLYGSGATCPALGETSIIDMTPV